MANNRDRIHAIACWTGSLLLTASLTACGGGSAQTTPQLGASSLSAQQYVPAPGMPVPSSSLQGNCLDGVSDATGGVLCTQVGTQTTASTLDSSRRAIQSVLLNKSITVKRGVATRAATTWDIASCTKSSGTGSYSINTAPKHGTLSLGTASGPAPGCPAGSPSLPAATADYTWTDGPSSTATGDYFVLNYNLNGGVAGTANVSVSLAVPTPTPAPPVNTCGSEKSTESIASEALGLTLKSTQAQCPLTTAQKILAAALAYENTDTSNGPACSKHAAPGSCACMWTIENILAKAGVRVPLLTNKVAAFIAAMESAGMEPIPQSQAVSGDLAVQGDERHIGVCLNNGCTSVISNSSSQASFSWVSNPEFTPTYRKNVTPLFFHFP